MIRLCRTSCGRAFFELFHGNLFEERHRIAIQRSPQYGVQLAEQRGGIVIPTPPEVLGKCPELVIGRRDKLLQGPGFGNDGCQLLSCRGEHPDGLSGENVWLDGLYHDHTQQKSVAD